MGTNLLIVLPGSTSSRRRAGRLRLDADAHVGRPAPPSAARSPTREGRRAVAPLEHARRQRGPELDDERHRHVARVLRHPQLAHRARASRFTQADVDGGTKVIVLGPDRRREALRRRTPTPSGRPCASAARRSRSSASRRRRGSRRRGRTTTTPLHPVHDVRAQDPGRPAASTCRGRSSSAATSSDDDRRARSRTSRRSCATATTSRPATTTTSRSAT